MTIILGADPFAYTLKKSLAEHLQKRGITVIDTDNYEKTPYYDVAIAIFWGSGCARAAPGKTELSQNPGSLIRFFRWRH